MGKFLDGLENATAAAERLAAEKRQRAEAAAAALRRFADILDVDREAFARLNLSLATEHAALVVKKLREPLAAVSYDPDSRTYKIAKYLTDAGDAGIEVADAEDCAIKLGEYIYKAVS
jgi:hypothetical protein